MLLHVHVPLFLQQYDHRPVQEKHSDHQFSVVAKQNPNVLRFNESAYILGSSRDSADAYKKNAFNQVESDKLLSNRKVPDTRHSRFVGCLCVVKRLDLPWRLAEWLLELRQS